MTHHADLELSLSHREADSYVLQLRFTLPDSDVETRLLHETPLVRFDDEQLSAYSLDDVRYGALLGAALFADPQVKAAFQQARDTAQSLQAPLRLRLCLDFNAAALHRLRWETLRHPDDGGLLFTGEQVYFSRYLSSGDWRPVQLRAQSALRALVMVANPANLEQYRLAPLDEPAELARARAGLQHISTTQLGPPATLNTLSTALRDGCDIVYLVCHGALIKGEPVLYLADEANQVKPLRGADLLTRFKEQAQLPSLVLLVSCQSAGDGAGEALTALGPQLAEAGVPAVLAMQGKLSMDTAARFLPVFFSELQRDGCIDRAISVARGTVRERPDWWLPVLFMRLKSGQLWTVEAPAPPRQEYEPETVPIPGGSFTMGSEPGNGIPPHETPAHALELPAYRIGKYPVTNREYAVFLQDDPGRDAPDRQAGCALRQPGKARLDHPVTGVSWDDARAYTAWLSTRTGRHYRLPSEAEWEKAARGTQGQRYPWGEVWADGCCQAAAQASGAVTAYPAGASVYGCEGMLGNVQEWTSTLWGSEANDTAFPYPYRPGDGREDLEAARHLHRTYRIHRGGSYRDAPATLRCSARGYAAPESKVLWRGFRVVLALD
jgi:formylglycine-generating enzyme required for sulfatase activity